MSNPPSEITVTKTIPVIVNGEPRKVSHRLNVLQLLEELEVDPSRVAVEMNRSIVHKQNWTSTLVTDSAQIEIVWFVGGGLS